MISKKTKAVNAPKSTVAGSSKLSDAAKARDEARKRMIEERKRQMKQQKKEIDDGVEVFIAT